MMTKAQKNQVLQRKTKGIMYLHLHSRTYGVRAENNNTSSICITVCFSVFIF
jgi:hypothetical protein